MRERACCAPAAGAAAVLKAACALPTVSTKAETRHWSCNPQVSKCRVASVRDLARDPLRFTCWLRAGLLTDRRTCAILCNSRAAYLQAYLPTVTYRPAHLQPVEGGAEDLEVLPRVATRAHDGLPLLPATIGERGCNHRS